MMAAPAPQAAAPAAPLNTAETKKKKPIHFPVKQLGTLAACLAVCVLGYSTLHLGIGMGSAKSSAPALYAAEGAANSSAASMASDSFAVQHAALDSAPEVVNYSLEADDRSLETEYSGTGSTEAAAPAVDSAKIIYTANLTLESKDYEAARSALDSALAEAGGYLESSSEYSSSGSSRSVNLTYRVPQANYQSFLEAVAAAGNVTYRSQQADDVTTQYMDVSARLSNLQAQRTRLQQLQAQAETLSDLLQIEDSLTEVQSQIESWQSQLDWYSDQVQQCTVYIDLNEVQTYTPADEGFFSRIGTALVSGWGNFVNGLQQLVVALASVWPLAVLACAAVAVALAWRKKHPKK
uniref:DUF4349 domain-containing protein n=1 Tax=Faecalibacterium prausnitzii TaxID=853 RepID=UPI0040299E5D